MCIGRHPQILTFGCMYRICVSVYTGCVLFRSKPSFIHDLDILLDAPIWYFISG